MNTSPRWKTDRPVRVGVSSCLLGQEVRFDGGHKRDSFLTDVLGDFVEWVPSCPEVDIGLPTPRVSLRLVAVGDGVRMRETKTGADLTERMQLYARGKVEDLEGQDICGYVLKKDSPSCGLHRVRVYDDASGMPNRKGRGLFAEVLVNRFPYLPIEDEGRLSDPALRDNFIERVFAYARLNGLFADGWTPGELVTFHTAHKMQLLAHSPDRYRQLGRIVADCGKVDRAETESAYSRGFMTALEVMATTGRHVNVLQHAAGHFKKTLESSASADLAGAIDDYRRGFVPLVVPVVLLGHLVRRNKVAYLDGQTYLEPHPKELKLRSAL